MSALGKVALITGGAGGLGKAFATSLLKEKASAVCLLDITKNGQEVAKQLSDKFESSKIEYIHCDITDYEAFHNTFKKTVEMFGKLDIVCNNAGISADDRNLKRSVAALRLNLEAVYYGTKLGMDYMGKSNGGKGGVIVNVASLAAFVPFKNTMVYCGAKSGVVALSRSAALSYKDNGVRVHSLCPAYVDTPILDTVPSLREFIAKRLEGQLLNPEFVAEGFMQLVTDETLNGKVMTVTPEYGLGFHSYKEATYEWPRLKDSTKSKL